VLEGLHYLHTHTPPIYHRALRCENLFISGNVSQVKIGLLEMAPLLDFFPPAELRTTPGFAAPEFTGDAAPAHDKIRRLRVWHDRAADVHLRISVQRSTFHPVATAAPPPPPPMCLGGKQAFVVLVSNIGSDLATNATGRATACIEETSKTSVIAIIVSCSVHNF
jgi:serine/threonine protein kinase